MPRPAPKIIDARQNSRWVTTEIVEPAVIYTVCYDGVQIIVRVHDALRSPTPYKYRTAMFTFADNAFAKAAEMNALFHTDKFEVYTMTVGEKATHKEDAE